MIPKRWIRNRTAAAGIGAAAVAIVAVWGLGAGADEPKKPGATPAKSEAAPEPGLVRLGPNVWMDKARKRVVVQAEVVQREAQLEQLLCLKGTKEHEAILAVDARAYVIHAGLLAIGAKPGRPVQFQPEYRPASGQRIDVWLKWTADGREHRVRAQQWIYNLRTKAAMTEHWVFAGSLLLKDPQTGEAFYQAEDGDVICVANFPSAMLDIAIQSSSSNSELVFEAFTERIPPVGTRVTVTLEPVSGTGDEKAPKDRKSQGESSRSG